MDTIRTESTSSLSSLYFSLHMLWRIHCGVPDFWLLAGPTSCWPAHSLQKVQKLDIHHQHRLLFYAHQTHSAHHLNENLLDREQVETGKISTWQSLPALNYISVSTRQCPHIFLPLFHPLHSLSVPFQIGRMATSLVAEKNKEKGWMGLKAEWWRWEVDGGNKGKAYPPGSTFWHQRRGPRCSQRVREQRRNLLWEFTDKQQTTWFSPCLPPVPSKCYQRSGDIIIWVTSGNLSFYAKDWFSPDPGWRFLKLSFREAAGLHWGKKESHLFLNLDMKMMNSQELIGHKLI